MTTFYHLFQVLPQNITHIVRCQFQETLLAQVAQVLATHKKLMEVHICQAKLIGSPWKPLANLLFGPQPGICKTESIQYLEVTPGLCQIIFIRRQWMKKRVSPSHLVPNEFGMNLFLNLKTEKKPHKTALYFPSAFTCNQRCPQLTWISLMLPKHELSMPPFLIPASLVFPSQAVPDSHRIHSCISYWHHSFSFERAAIQRPP